MTNPQTHARMFFALWPTAATARKLAGHARTLEAQAGGRVTRTDSIHLTLAFLGDIALDRLDTLLAPPADVTAPAFELYLDRLGLWRRNGIGWAAPSRIPEALVDLQMRLSAWLLAAGFRLEARPFVPHVTLIRKAPGMCPEMAIPPIAWTVREFVLVRSRLSAAGSRYETLDRFALNHEAGADVTVAPPAGEQ